MQSLLLGAMEERRSAWQSWTQTDSPTTGIFAILTADKPRHIIKVEIQNLFYVVWCFQRYSQNLEAQRRQMWLQVTHVPFRFWIFSDIFLGTESSKFLQYETSWFSPESSESWDPIITPLERHAVVNWVMPWQGHWNISLINQACLRLQTRRNSCPAFPEDDGNSQSM